MSIASNTARTRQIGRSIVTGAAASLLFLSGCLHNDGNPVAPPVEVTKNGVIPVAEAWTETDKVYRITADCSIEAPVTWGRGITVAVDPAVVIRIANNGILTIGERVAVKFGSGAYIGVGDQSPGTLVAAGSAAAPVVFKADMGVSAWGLSTASRSGGIVLGDSANNCRLSYCTIIGAATGIYCRTVASSITNCTISSCKDDGVYFDSAAGPVDFASFTNNTIGDCGGYPLTLPADKLGNLTAAIAFTGAATGKRAICVTGAMVEDSAAIWRKLSLPYVFSGTTQISSFNRLSSVTIMPGVVCRFEPGAFINIGDPRFGSGTLLARGTPADSIFFVNNQPNIAWGDSSGGICVGMESPANTVLEYCSFSKATTGIFVNPGVRVTVSHCRITGCEFNGMTFAGGSPFDSTAFNGNIFTRNAGYGISITADQLVNLSGSGSVAGNGKGGIYVSGAEVWQSGTWKKYDAPYIVDGVLDIGNSADVAIGIAPGTEFRFLSDAYLRVGNANSGTLIANGSAALPIVFTSAEQGIYWGTGIGSGIRIEQYAGASTTLSSCKIFNATNGVYVNAKAKIQNCIVQNNRYYGLVRDKNADVALIKGNLYSGNGTDSVYVTP